MVTFEIASPRDGGTYAASSGGDYSSARLGASLGSGALLAAALPGLATRRAVVLRPQSARPRLTLPGHSGSPAAPGFATRHAVAPCPQHTQPRPRLARRWWWRPHNLALLGIGGGGGLAAPGLATRQAAAPHPQRTRPWPRLALRWCPTASPCLVVAVAVAPRPPSLVTR